jgi:hypothetical protein
MLILGLTPIPTPTTRDGNITLILVGEVARTKGKVVVKVKLVVVVIMCLIINGIIEMTIDTNKKANTLPLTTHPVLMEE